MTRSKFHDLKWALSIYIRYSSLELQFICRNYWYNFNAYSGTHPYSRFFSGIRDWGRTCREPDLILPSILVWSRIFIIYQKHWDEFELFETGSPHSICVTKPICVSSWESCQNTENRSCAASLKSYAILLLLFKSHAILLLLLNDGFYFVA